MKSVLFLLSSVFVMSAPADIFMPTQNPMVKSGGGKVEFSENVKDHDAVIRVVEANLNGLKTCYKKALKRDAAINGDMLVEWEVAPNGKAKSAQFAENKIKNGDFNDCVMRRFKSWRFPRTSDRKPGTIVYSFEFKEKEDAPPES